MGKEEGGFKWREERMWEARGGRRKHGEGGRRRWERGGAAGSRGGKRRGRRKERAGRRREMGGRRGRRRRRGRGRGGGGEEEGEGRKDPSSFPPSSSLFMDCAYLALFVNPNLCYSVEGKVTKGEDVQGWPIAVSVISCLWWHID